MQKAIISRSVGKAAQAGSTSHGHAPTAAAPISGAQPGTGARHAHLQLRARRFRPESQLLISGRAIADTPEPEVGADGWDEDAEFESRAGEELGKQNALWDAPEQVLCTLRLFANDSCVLVDCRSVIS